MFEMLYEHKTGQMFFIMENMMTKNDGIPTKFYKFCLLKNNTICLTLQRLLKTTNIFNYNTPLQHRRNTIVLSENTVSMLLNSYRHIMWTIRINDAIQCTYHLCNHRVRQCKHTPNLTPSLGLRLLAVLPLGWFFQIHYRPRPKSACMKVIFDYRGSARQPESGTCKFKSQNCGQLKL